MNWPFEKNYKDICSQSENGDTGFYPFGAGNLWHSGIHIQADKDVIEPIVNGQLVSYRLGSEKHCGTLPQKVTSTYYETLMADYRELYKKGEKNVYKLQQEGKRETTNCYMLFRHEIPQLDYTFYTLYANLDLITGENERHFKGIVEYDGKAHNCLDRPIEITKIPVGNAYRKKAYFDFIVFSEKNIFSAKKSNTATELLKIKDKARIYKKKEMISIEKTGTYLISSGSSYKKIEERTNGTETCSKIELKSFNAFYKIENKEACWVTPHNYYHEHIDFRQNSLLKDSLKYLQDILTAGNFTEKYRLKTTDHRDTSRAEIPFSELDNIKNPVFWLNEAGSRDFPAKTGEVGKCATGKNYDEYEVFPECPFKYEFEECGEDVDAADFEINEDAVYWGTIGKGGENANFRRIDGTEYFVRDSDVRKCPAFDWEEWFMDMTKKKAGRSVGIICDKNELIRNINCGDELNTLFGDAKKYYPQNFYRVFGGYGDDDSSKRAVMKIRAETRKMACKHPLEFDKSLFPESKKDCKKFSRKYRKSSRDTAIISPTTAGCLRVEASNFDLWDNALNQIFGKENSFFFLHPAYSLRHFERAGLFEFNPYAGMTIRPRFAEGNDPDIEVKSNPGFAPAISRRTNNYDIERFTIKKTINGTLLYWATVNYDFGVTEGYGGNHTGIDLAGYEGTGIYALVNGIVWATTYQETIKNTYYDKNKKVCYGRCMVIKGDNDKLYLLGHLSKFRKKEGERIQVGDIVAEVGDTGYSFGAHLHLEVFSFSKKQNYQDILWCAVGENINYHSRNLLNKMDGGTGDSSENGLAWAEKFNNIRGAVRKHPLKQ